MRTVALSAACSLLLGVVVGCVSSNRDVYAIDGEDAGAGQGGQGGANGATGDGGGVFTSGQAGAPRGGDGGAVSGGRAGAPRGGRGGALRGGAGGTPAGGEGGGPLGGAGADGGWGGAGGNDCPYEIVRVPDDPDGILAYTVESLEDYCQVGNCPSTVEEAVSELDCSHDSDVWQVVGCGYTHVLEHDTSSTGYVFDNATGQLVGAHLHDDVAREPCNVFSHYAGMKPDACIGVRWDEDAGAYVSAGGAGSTFTDLCEEMGGAGGQGPGGAGGQNPGGAGGTGTADVAGHSS